MALEDIAMFRTLLDCVVLYPGDAVSAEKLTSLAASHFGNVYIRTTRAETPVIYDNGEEFKIGGLKVHKSRIKNHESRIVVIGAGITLHEALKAQQELAEKGIGIDVIDLYSVKPIDLKTLGAIAKKSKAIITVEDNHHEGGIGEAVLHALQNLLNIQIPVKILSTTKMPKSGKPAELLRYEEIDARSIIEKVRELINE